MLEFSNPYIFVTLWSKRFTPYFNYSRKRNLKFEIDYEIRLQRLNDVEFRFKSKLSVPRKWLKNAKQGSSYMDEKY